MVVTNLNTVLYGMMFTVGGCSFHCMFGSIRERRDGCAVDTSLLISEGQAQYDGDGGSSGDADYDVLP